MSGDGEEIEGTLDSTVRDEDRRSVVSPGRDRVSSGRGLVPPEFVEWAEERGISPVIGTLLVVVITLMLASTMTATLMMHDDSLEDHREQFERVTEEKGNPWVGSLSGLVQPSNNEAGATDVRYRINFKYSRPNGNSVPLTEVQLEVNTGSPNMFSNTSEAKLEYVTVDTDGDGDADKYITSSVNGWDSFDGGTEMEIYFDGSHQLQGGDSIVAVFGGVDNPTAPGVYELEVRTTGAGTAQTGNVTIV